MKRTDITQTYNLVLATDSDAMRAAAFTKCFNGRPALSIIKTNGLNKSLLLMLSAKRGSFPETFKLRTKRDKT
jgi:hypothetical protein